MSPKTIEAVKPPERKTQSAPASRLAIPGVTLEWIAADAFTVDPSYDRAADENRINYLAEHWKDEALGVVFSSRRANEDKLYLLDGQHRIGALRKQGRKTDLVPTLVFEGLTVPQEAELFVMMNKNRRALSPSELFKASLVEGNKGAIEIQKVIEQLNLTMESFAASSNPYAIKCVATIWRIYRAMGASGVDATLSLSLLAWGDPPPYNAFNQNLLLVVARILFYNENHLDIDRLRSVLAKEAPNEILSRAKTIGMLQGGDRGLVLAKVIVDAYNKGLRPTQQLDMTKLRPNSDPFTSAARFRRGGKRDGE
jgi:hypothetical protein